MRIAYVDSSCLVSIALGEPFHRELIAFLSRFDRLYSSTLLEAELRSAVAREGKPETVKNVVAWLNWVYPRRRLNPQFDQVLKVGTPRGSDLWHLACALVVRARAPETFFITLDRQQGDIARSLGFRGL